MRSRLKSAKKSAKNLTVDQKIAQWEKIAEAGGIELSRSVRGCSVIVVDDLYQSGASLWSFAKYLKRNGAGAVVGLVCVKSLRDTDNQ
jgi:predicted amidophosphoribosyltransferase